MLRDFFVRLKQGTEYLNYGRSIIADWGANHAIGRLAEGETRVLDLGCGHGTDLLNIRKDVVSRLSHYGSLSELGLYGIENYPPYVEECRREGIQVESLDVEHDPLPWKDGTFDVVVANQVLEHTKEIYWIVAEVVRVLKPGGIFLVGVPNLASLHNRLLLLFGQQPTAIQTHSAHVRGFTRRDFHRFAELGGYLKPAGVKGSNFYPFPPLLSRPLAALFPSLAWGAFFRLERTGKQGDFLECLQGEENFLETPFYGGPINPAPGSAGKKSSSSSATAKKRTATGSSQKGSSSRRSNP